MGLVTLDIMTGRFVDAYKPQTSHDGDPYYNRHVNLIVMAEAFADYLEKHNPVCVVLENYYMALRSNNFKQAELHGMLKRYLWDKRVSYVLVAGTQRTKFLLPKRVTSKQAKDHALAYVECNAPEAFAKFKRRADHKDIADAYVLAQLGRMTFYRKLMGTYNAGFERVPKHWREIIDLTPTSLLNKLGSFEHLNHHGYDEVSHGFIHPPVYQPPATGPDIS